MLAYATQQARQSPMLNPSTQEDRNARLLYLNTAMVGVATGGIAAFLPVFLARLGASTAFGLPDALLDDQRALSRHKTGATDVACATRPPRKPCISAAPN